MAECLVLYGLATALFALFQGYENWLNGPTGRYWAPVWWIALTWPFWVVVAARDGLRALFPPRAP